MKPLLFIGLAVIVAGVAAAASSARPSTQHYLVSMHLRDGDREIGAPSLEVVAGKPARLAIGNAAGDHYAIGITATPASAQTVTLASRIEVVAAGVHHNARPTVMAKLGTPVALDLPADPGAKPLHVDFTVTRAR